MQICRTPAEMQAASRDLRRSGRALGLVPTMGALHAGHLSLVSAARAECDAVAASIFVNPTQFGPNEDYAAYPRTFDEDCRKLTAAGVHLLFAPSAADIYPADNTTFVDPGPIADRLDGASRPGHFRGVATIVTRLFNIVAPDRAYFGQKDAAQVAVLRHIVRDLNLPVSLVVCPIVREPDGLEQFLSGSTRGHDSQVDATPRSGDLAHDRKGHGNSGIALALSSRNRYLSPPERARALILSRALRAAEALAARGETSAVTLRAAMLAVFTQPDPDPTLAAVPVTLDYAAIVDPDTLLPIPDITPGALLAVAAHIGPTRLIDNLVIHPGSRT